MIKNLFRKYFFSKVCWKVMCLVFFSLFINYQSTAQNVMNAESTKFYKVISYDEKIDFGDIDTSVLWNITNSRKNISATLRGNEINNYLFQEPGEYEIKFYENKKHDEDCHHPLLKETFTVKVQPVKLSFDFSKIKFSQKIEQGRIYSDLIITVPAKIAAKDYSITKLPAPGMSVSGLGVSFTTEPQQNEIILNSNIALLKYKISGSVTKETYLMFDFYDFNGGVQTYNLPQIIK